MKVEKLGWIVAAGLAGAMAMSGFQGQNLKFATVDVIKVFTNSNLYKQNSDELEMYHGKRMEVLRYLDAHAEMNPNDFKQYPELQLEAKPSDADSAKLTKLKADADAAQQKHRDLATKEKPTADDQALMSSITQTMTQNRTSFAALQAQFQKDFDAENQRLTNEALEKVRKSIRELAVKEGYNIVFNIDSAPYAANNLTDSVLKDVNKS